MIFVLPTSGGRELYLGYDIKNGGEDDFVRILYPNINLNSERISNLLSYRGEEGSYRDFFKEYTQPRTMNDGLTVQACPTVSICHLTAINNHNGKISNEMRLILCAVVGDQATPVHALLTTLIKPSLS